MVNKFDLAVKRSKVNLRSSFEKTVDLVPKAFLVLEKAILSVSTIYGHCGILFSCEQTFEQIGNTLFIEGPM